jgi:hypothetical protein
MNYYLNTDAHEALAVKVARELPPCRYNHGLDLDGARFALGEGCNIWPASIRADTRAHGHE